MTHRRTLVGVTMISLALAAPVFAQTTTTTPAPADPTTTTPAPADTTAPATTPAPADSTAPATPPADATAPAAAPMAPMDCEAQFTALDTDANGFLSETEAPQAYAWGRVGDMTVDAKGYDHDAFVKLCSTNTYAHKTPEEGAPFEGANSFTEGQAQDRALAWGVAGVSALTKDDKGVWRGTGMVDGAAVSVAIDYKGNVVTAKN